MNRPGTKVKGRLYGDGRVYEYWHGQHPLFPGANRILRARRKLAEHIGRPLKRHEIAHHRNEVRDNDRLRNLQLMMRNEHLRHHGTNPSAEARRKMSLAQMGRNVSADTRRKISKALLGRKHSEEARVGMRGPRNGPEARARMSAAQIMRWEGVLRNDATGACEPEAY